MTVALVARIVAVLADVASLLLCPFDRELAGAYEVDSHKLLFILIIVCFG